jgi:1-deoxy-D-xylulose-5-phosphate reductoisomerase
LTYPERWENQLPSVDLTKVKTLEFFEPDQKKFPCLGLAREALRIGGTMTAVLNAANEISVHNFLMEKLPFTAISRIVESTMEQHNSIPHPSLEDVLDADHWARKQAESFVAQIVH